jgi:hypothetical protein
MLIAVLTLGLIAVVLGLVIYLAVIVSELAELVRFLLHGLNRGE